MPVRIYRAAEGIKLRFPKVYGFVYAKLPGAIKQGTDDILADTLESARAGVDKNGKPLTNYWAYLERTFEQKKMDRNAERGEAEAAQYRLDITDARGLFNQLKEFSAAKAQGKI